MAKGITQQADGDFIEVSERESLQPFRPVPPGEPRSPRPIFPPGADIIAACYSNQVLMAPDGGTVTDGSSQMALTTPPFRSSLSQGGRVSDIECEQRLRSTRSFVGRIDALHGNRTTIIYNRAGAARLFKRVRSANQDIDLPPRHFTCCHCLAPDLLPSLHADLCTRHRDDRV